MNPTDQAAFLAAIRDDPADDTPRLVYADWLQEQATPEAEARAAFIRAQCGAGPPASASRASIPWREWLPKAFARKRGWMTAGWPVDDRPFRVVARLEWSSRNLVGTLRADDPDPPPWQLVAGPADSTIAVEVEFRRGFVSRVSMPVDVWADLFRELRDDPNAVIDEVELHGVNLAVSDVTGEREHARGLSRLRYTMTWLENSPPGPGERERAIMSPSPVQFHLDDWSSPARLNLFRERQEFAEFIIDLREWDHYRQPVREASLRGLRADAIQCIGEGIWGRKTTYTEAVERGEFADTVNAFQRDIIEGLGVPAHIFRGDTLPVDRSDAYGV